MVQKYETIDEEKGGKKVNLFETIKKKIRTELFRKVSTQRKLDFDFS